MKHLGKLPKSFALCLRNNRTNLTQLFWAKKQFFSSSSALLRFNFVKKPFVREDETHEIRKQKRQELRESTKFSEAEKNYRLAQTYERDFTVDSFLKSIEHYRLAADKGKLVSYFKLGNLYESGFDGKYIDMDAALESYTKAAQVHPLAASKLGFWYRKGINVKKDMEKSIKYHEDAALAGVTASMVELAFHQLMTNKDVDSNVGLLELAVRKNNRLAKLRLGLHYLHDKTSRSRRKRAALLLRDVAKFFPRAKYETAINYWEGILLPKNIKLYFTLLRELVDQNYPSALMRLAWVKLEGESLSKDVRGGLELISRAAEMDYGPALYALGSFYWWGTHVEQNKKLASRYFSRGAKMKNPLCLYKLGLMMLEQDDDRGLELIKEAAVLKYPKAILFLARSIKRGIFKADDKVLMDLVREARKLELRRLNPNDSSEEEEEEEDDEETEDYLARDFADFEEEENPTQIRTALDRNRDHSSRWDSD